MVEINLWTKKSIKTIQQLGAQVETLTNMMTALMDQQTAARQAAHSKALPAQVPDQPQTCFPSTSIASHALPPIPGQPPFTRKSKVPSCTNCLLQGSENCNHCFVCGDPGYRAVGCLKRTRQQGNRSSGAVSCCPSAETAPQLQSHSVTPCNQ